MNKYAYRRLLDVKAAAAYIGTKVFTVRKLIYSGALPTVSLCRKKLIDIADLDKLIEARKEVCND